MSKTFDHSNPNQHFRKYLDAEGKYKGHTPCKCPECKARRAK